MADRNHDTRCRWLFLLVPFLHTAALPAADDCKTWQPVRHTPEGTVYHRCRTDSTTATVMIQTRFPAPPQRLFGLATDYAAFAQFVPGVRDSRVLETAGNRQWIYQHLHFPGPVRDRVYILRSTGTETTPGRAWRIEWELSDRAFPQADLAAGMRPRQLSGFWEITRAETPGTTIARYAVHSDPGGWLPDWLVESMTDRYVQDVVAAFRRRLATESE